MKKYILIALCFAATVTACKKSTEPITVDEVAGNALPPDDGGGAAYKWVKDLRPVANYGWWDCKQCVKVEGVGTSRKETKVDASFCAGLTPPCVCATCD